MYKFFLTLLCFFYITGCATSGTALLGPMITGAKSGSVYQTSLSYSSGKIIENLKSDTSTYKSQSKKTYINRNPILPDVPYIDKDPKILLTYKVNNVKISSVIEPEPLP